MIDLEDNATIIGEYMFNRHKGILGVASIKHNDDLNYDSQFMDYNTGEWVDCFDYYPVDTFYELIDALNEFKDKGLCIKLDGKDFQKLIEGSHAALESCNGYCEVDDCSECKNPIESLWVNFNRYDFIKGYGIFRRLVLIRDDYTCLCCGNTNEKDLQVHHIRSFKNNLELATSVKNGATLCKECHKKYHKKYGYNAKQETFSKFIKEMVD